MLYVDISNVSSSTRSPLTDWLDAPIRLGRHMGTNYDDMGADEFT